MIKKVAIFIFIFAVFVSLLAPVQAQEEEKSFAEEFIEFLMNPFKGLNNNLSIEDSGTRGDIPLPQQSNTSPNTALNNNTFSVDYSAYGLPQPSVDRAQDIKTELLNNPSARWAASALLAGEEKLIKEGLPVKPYLTTAWVWYEANPTLNNSWPDPYSQNCNDSYGSRNITDICPENVNKSNSIAKSLFQVAGYQLQTQAKNMIDTYGSCYADESLSNVMTEVFRNSTYASRSQWKYTEQASHPFITANLWGGNVPANINMSDVTPTALFVADQPQYQARTVLLGKDPCIVIGLNRFAVSDSDLIAGLKNNRSVYSYVSRSNLAIMVEALRLFDEETKAQPLSGEYTAPPDKPYYDPSTAAQCGYVPRLIDVFANGVQRNNCRAGVPSDTEEEIRRQLVTIELLGTRIQVHQKAAPAFKAVHASLEQFRVEGQVYKFAKGEYRFKRVESFNYRCNVNANSGTNTCTCVLSNHSFGTAVDLNPDENANGSNVWDMPPEVVNAFENNGFRWGGRYGEVFGSTPDAMHFEYLEGVC